MAAVRPVDFTGFIGQRRIVRNLEVAIKAAQDRQEPLDHCLFSGPAGLGKTTLSNIIANAMGSDLTITSGAVLKSPRDLIGSLVRLERGDILFIDEMHRIPMTVEEYLYTAMEDFAIDSVNPSGIAVRIELNAFTMIGATTREGLLSEPLLARFGLICRLEAYDPSDLVEIINKIAVKRHFTITANAAWYIAERSRGTPRVALRTQRRVRDYAQVHNNSVLDLDVTKLALKELGIYEHGINKKDLAVLEALESSSGPIGLTNLAIMSHESKDTIENVLEPHMIRCGLIQRQSRGRIITVKGSKFLETLKHDN